MRDKNLKEGGGDGRKRRRKEGGLASSDIALSLLFWRHFGVTHGNKKRRGKGGKIADGFCELDR